MAIGPGGLIGRHGSLPWRCPADLAQFRQLTMGHTLIMGRSTYDSLPPVRNDRGPLPGRHLIVVTSRPLPEGATAESARNMDDAITLAHHSDPNPFIAGGARIYQAAAATITDWHLTHIGPSHLVGTPADDDVHLEAVDLSSFRLVEQRPLYHQIRYEHWQRSLPR